MMDRPDSFATLQSVTVPTLIVTGEEDALTPVEDARKMHAAQPKAELVIIPGAGHLPISKPRTPSTPLLAGFLARV